VRGRGSWLPGVEQPLSRRDAERVARRLWGMLRPWRGQMVLGLVLLVLQTAALLAGPTLIRYGIDHGITGHDGAALDRAALLFLVAAVSGLVLGRFTILILSRVGERFLRALRERVFRHLLGLGMDFFEKEQTGRLVARMTSDVDALQDLIQFGLIMFVQNALLLVGALVVIFVLSWKLALFTLVLLPPLVLGSRWFRRESNRAYLAVRDRIGTNLATLQEGLAGVRVVQAFAQEASVTQRFRGTNEAQFDANMDTVRIALRYFPAVELGGVAGVALILGVGGWFADQRIVTVGTVVAFVLYLNNLFEPVQQLSQLYNLVQQSGAALHKLFELLDTRPSITERPGAVDLPEHGAIEIEHVSFAYGADDVLHDVTLHVEPSERIALVGPTGAGKSTLAKLIARFYDPRDGTVRYGGVDLRDATLASLRDRIVVVPQEGFLFAGSVRENLLAGKADATPEEMAAAVEALGLTPFFEALPKGLETEVRERGSRLSAGERQLVSLVRAALADPAVLVLDEATSNLDPGTEQAVEQAMERLMEHRTVVVVAHRLSTAARADRIAVVDDGLLAELGTHAELVAREGRYASLYAAWTAGVAQARIA
jgi:ATP-binding cassette subfamily B protein